MEKTNADLHSYNGCPITEGHAHCYYNYEKNPDKFNRIDVSAEKFKHLMKYFNINKLAVNSVTFLNETDNFRGLYLKDRLAPSVFANASIDYFYNENDTAKHYLDEIKLYRRMGFDGMKMLEGKIEQYNMLTNKLDSKLYDEYFAYAEENEIPILMHLGDPIEMWNAETAPQFAIEAGWVYGDKDPTLEELRIQVDKILEKFPGLHLIMAHFNFMSEELERASKLMDRYKNLCFDLAPGGEMFVGFTKNYDEAKAFFIKYQDRLIYGTDFYDENGDIERTQGLRANLVRSFLEKNEGFTQPVLSDITYKPFGFEGSILDKIYRENFARIYGEMPRMLDREMIIYECRKFIQGRQLDSRKLADMRVISEYFGKYKNN